MFSSLKGLDLPLGAPKKQTYDARAIIIEQDPLEEESLMNFEQSLRSPQSASGQTFSEVTRRTCRSQTQDFTFEVANEEEESKSNRVI
jgi:hypothetical protein